MRKYILRIVTSLFIFCLLLSGCTPKDTLTINGFYLGKKVPTGREYLAMDASFLYYKDNVGYDVDGEDCVEEMDFHCQYGMNELKYGLADAKVYYHGTRLTTLAEMIDSFGVDFVPVPDTKYQDFTFEDEELIVNVSVRYGEFNGMVVSPK